MRGDVAASILMVDDDPHVLRSLRAALESHGYRVRTAASGPIALEACAEERPDVVFQGTDSTLVGGPRHRLFHFLGNEVLAERRQEELGSPGEVDQWRVAALEANGIAQQIGPQTGAGRERSQPDNLGA